MSSERIVATTYELESEDVMKKKQITTMTNTDKATYPPPLAGWCKKKKQIGEDYLALQHRAVLFTGNPALPNIPNHTASNTAGNRTTPHAHSRIVRPFEIFCHKYGNKKLSKQHTITDKTLPILLPNHQRQYSHNHCNVYSF